jgi:hypothetical protein
MVLPIGLSLACLAPDPASRGVSGDSAVADYEAPVAEPMWGVGDVSAALSALMESGAPNPLDVATDFSDWLLHGDGTCPESIHRVGRDCTSDDGYSYQGIGWFEINDYSEGDSTALDWRHGGDYQFVDPGFLRLEGGGEIFYYTDRSEGQSYQVEIAGSWRDQTRADWLGDGYSSVMVVEGGGDAESAWMTFEGGMAVGDVMVDLDAFGFDMASACGAAPTGAVNVRDPAGYWYNWDLGSTCGTCAPLLYGTESLGELCVEVGAWSAAFFASNAPRPMDAVYAPSEATE